MQLHTDITENHTLKESLPLLNNNIATALSQSAGNAFPLTGLQVGMPCVRLDTGKAYVLTDAVAQAWKEYFDFTTGQAPDSSKFGGELPEFYQNAANLNTGTIPAARLTGTYSIAVSGNAGSATKLATARTINGVSFNGTANITIADDTKIPLAGGVATGALGAPSIGITNSSNTSGDGLSLYSGAKAGAPDYGLMFSGTATFGTHGAVVGDSATYFTMSGATNRGWIFKSGKAIGGNVASISATGVITAADMKIGVNQVWHAGNHGAGSGLDADLLDGAQLDAAATANTVAKRDGSADINARLFRSNYANQSTISGAIAFRTNNTTDNYIRYCSDPTAVRAWLDAAPTSHSHTWAQITGAPATATRWPTFAEVTGKPTTYTPSAHSHDYLPLSGGALTGNLVVPSIDAIFLEVGNTKGIASTPFLDFHSGVTPCDYDSRIIASGGNGVSGNGVINYMAARHIFNSAVNSRAINFHEYDNWATNSAPGQYDVSGGGAAIVNDGGSYKCLMILGNRSAGGVRIVKVWDELICTGNVTAFSDMRLKKDIKPIDSALDKVMQLGGYTYERTDIKGLGRQTGVLAQEVLKVLPEAVTGSEETNYSVAYGNMVGLLIEAIKELKAELNQLKGVAA